MKQLLRICLTGAFFLLFEGLLSPMLADNGKSDKEILVLNSINFNLPWARKLLLVCCTMFFRNRE